MGVVKIVERTFIPHNQPLNVKWLFLLTTDIIYMYDIASNTDIYNYAMIKD